MIAEASPGALRDLAAAVERLVPSWRDPERFWEQRSEIAGRLRKLAAQLERAPPGAIVGRGLRRG